MIIKGGSRGNGGFFAKHLLRTDENERVSVVDMRGLGRDGLPLREAFCRLEAMAQGTQIKNFFYHAAMNTRTDEVLTPEQWERAVDELEAGLGFTGQPRFIVEHDKLGRVHRHVVWSRVDPDTMKAIPDSWNYRTHEEIATRLEQEFGHEPTKRALTRDKEVEERPAPNPKDWESFRGAQTKIDPKAIKTEITELWHQSDNGQAFAAALAERGYILARGDRRAYCVIDAAGSEHSLARRLAGVKAAELREFLADIDQDSLPTVDSAREMVRQEADGSGDENASPFDRVMAETVEAATPPEQREKRDASPNRRHIRVTETAHSHHDAFASVMEAALKQAIKNGAVERAGSYFENRIEQFRAWCGSMREQVSAWGEQVKEYYYSYFRNEAAEAEMTKPITPEPPVPSHTQSEPEPQPLQTPGVDLTP